MKKELRTAIEASIKAGEEIMKIYENEDFQIESKKDESPLTIADKKANDIINKYLIPTGIPIISEENRQLSFEKRKVWKKCWIVDPLDGTKEFIKKNGEFTVNIALIEDGRPILGVIYVPAGEVLYFANVNSQTAHKLLLQSEGNWSSALSNAEEISPASEENIIRVVGSRSHMNEDTLEYIEALKREHDKEIEIVSKGSSLKFCLVAEGLADVYPRFAPTMEWDTAAGQAICEAVGLKVIDVASKTAMQYNRENLLNNYFLVSNRG